MITPCPLMIHIQLYMYIHIYIYIMYIDISIIFISVYLYIGILVLYRGGYLLLEGVGFMSKCFGNPQARDLVHLLGHPTGA